MPLTTHHPKDPNARAETLRMLAGSIRLEPVGRSADSRYAILRDLARQFNLDSYATWEQGAAAPHCDQRVLHRPGTCEYCDHYPHYQALRELWGVNFTGEHEPGKTTCPAESKRALSNIELWPGNVASAHGN